MTVGSNKTSPKVAALHGTLSERDVPETCKSVENERASDHNAQKFLGHTIERRDMHLPLRIATAEVPFPA